MTFSEFVNFVDRLVDFQSFNIEIGTNYGYALLLLAATNFDVLSFFDFTESEYVFIQEELAAVINEVTDYVVI